MTQDTTITDELAAVEQCDRDLYDWLVRRVPSLAVYNQHDHVVRLLARHRLSTRPKETPTATEGDGE